MIAHNFPDLLLTLLIPVLVLLHLFVAPYTKVEESFNIQAAHDIIYYGLTRSNATEFLTKHYDHVSFPGAVPRSFVGALALAGVSPWFGFLTSEGFHQQIVGRSILHYLLHCDDDVDRLQCVLFWG